MPTAPAVQPFQLPSDAQVYNNGLALMAVFDVGGVKLAYTIDWSKGAVQFDPAQVHQVSQDAFNQLGAVQAGDAEELRGMNTQYPSYKAFFDSILNTVMPAGSPARQDPSVLNVIAQRAARPDMSDQEFQNLLRGTTYWQQHTDMQRQYNDLSDAEKQKRRDDVAAQMAQTWFQYTGQPVDSTDPRLGNYVEQLASGQMGFGAWTERIVKPQALDLANSPWARQIADEQKAERQPGIDVENTAQRIKDLARRWGVQWAEGTYQDFGRKISTNEMSEADVLNAIKDQAQVLYPWKNRDVETSVAAAPWVETYKRVMETDADLSTPKVAQAMSAGQSMWDFEQSLKQSSGWLNTKNAKETMVSTIAEAGRRMGFQ